MIADVAIHMALEMGGAITFACIMGRCRNPEHSHGVVLRWIGRNPWKAQCVAAFVMAYATVRLIG